MKSIQTNIGVASNSKSNRLITMKTLCRHISVQTYTSDLYQKVDCQNYPLATTHAREREREICVPDRGTNGMPVHTALAQSVMSFMASESSPPTFSISINFLGRQTLVNKLGGAAIAPHQLRQDSRGLVNCPKA